MLQGMSLSQTLALAGMLMFVLLTMLALGFWAARDAAARGGDHPDWWGFVAASGISLPYVLWKLRQLPARTEPPTRAERLVQAWLGAALGAFVLSAPLSPPDPLSQAVMLAQVFPVLFAVAVGYVYLTSPETEPTTPR